MSRPAETDAIVNALVQRLGPAGITVGIVGAGGTGKSVIAQMACLDRRVLRRYRMRIYWITLGPDTSDVITASKVNDVIKLIFGQDATFTDPELAGHQLGALLDTGPRRLLVLDDVWDARQLAPFLNGGRSCARLVTTRRAGLLVGRGVTVRVDVMATWQARQLLTVGLPSLNPVLRDDLIDACGNWPLLLRLASAGLVSASDAGIDVATFASQLLERLRATGPAGVGLDVSQPGEQVRAVSAAIAASTSLLAPDDKQRFAELSVFVVDEDIPFKLAARLWHATAGLDDLQASKLRRHLSELSLISTQSHDDIIELSLHDVIRDFLRAELGPARLTELNALLLDEIAADLPSASSLDEKGGPPRVAWWQIDPDDRYLWDHLIGHMQSAGRTEEADDLANDPRWVGAQVLRAGAAPAGDRFASHGLWEEFDLVMASREFRPYEQHASKIRTRFVAEFGEFLNALRSKADDLSAAVLDAEKFGVYSQVRSAASRHRRVAWGLAVAALALLLLAYASLGGPFPMIFGGSAYRLRHYWLISVISISALSSGFGQLIIWYGRLRQVAIAQKIEVERSRSAYEQERSRLVAEAMRRSITDIFRSAMVIDFPLLAPTLVELSTAKVVPSSTQEEVRDFILNHDSSAIGIAGPRGSGKSTLMQAVAETKGLATHMVRLTAPVKYETLEFTRRLLRDVAREILLRAGYQPDADQRLRRQRIAAARFRRDIFILVIFLLLTFVVYLWSLTHTVWHWTWTTGLGYAMVGILVIIGSSPLLSLLKRFLLAFRPSPVSRNGDPLSVRMARSALETLAWDVEHEEKEKSSVTLFGDILDFEGEDSLKLTRHELSLPELVAEFRDLLAQFSAEGDLASEKRFVIFIDELDKIAETEGLIEAINGIKDLMHIPSVHLVVCVSVDALLRFEERGIPARDAFDSAFDAIIPMRCLTLRESLDILTTRAAAFPEALSLACHAWSGGLPRDLLRIARRCVTIQRNSAKDLHVAEIVRRFVTEDLRNHVTNAMRYAGSDLVESGKLTALDDIVSEAEQGLDPRKSWRKMPEPRLTKPIECIIETGLIILALFADDRNDDLVKSKAMRNKFELLATAAALRSEPVSLQEKHIDSLAREVLGGG